MTSRPFSDFPRSEQGLVDNFIGTAYDVVKNVGDNIPELQRLDEVLTEIPELAESTAAAAVELVIAPVRVELDSKVTEATQIIEVGQQTLDTAITQQNQAAQQQLDTAITGNQAAINQLITEADSEFDDKLALTNVSSNAAAIQAGIAQTFAQQAQVAATAASQNAAMYNTVALGLANTTNGSFFNVPVTGGNDALVLYRNDSGVATEIQRYLSAVGINRMIRRTGSQDVLRVSDGNGKSAIRLTRLGKFLVMGRDVLYEVDTALGVANNFAFTGSINNGFLVRDRNGKAPLRLTRTGRFKVWGRDILHEVDQLNTVNDFVAAQNELNKMFTPNKNLLIVGDSLMAYAGSWARTITDDLVDQNRTSTLLAVGGQTSSQQAGRLGALPFLITLQDNKILASGPTTVVASQMLAPDGKTLVTVYPVSPQGTGSTFRARLAGIAGVFAGQTYTGEIPATMTFTPDAGQLTVDLPVEVGIPTESLWAVGHEYDLILLGLGRNNYQDTETVKRDWLAVRNWQSTLNKRVVVVTPPNMSGEGIVSGPTKYAAIVELERYAQYLFGEDVVVSRQVLMRHPDTAIAGDLTAVADGRVPPSLTSDGLHWLPATGHAYIRAAAAAIINRKGY